MRDILLLMKLECNVAPGQFFGVSGSTSADRTYADSSGAV